MAAATAISDGNRALVISDGRNPRRFFMFFARHRRGKAHGARLSDIDYRK
jgi:hypothetical protein